MLFKAALALPAIWLPGRLLDIFGVYRVGDLAHVLLLIGPMLLLAMLEARDAALRPPNTPTED